jgi:hypothetical protein
MGDQPPKKAAEAAPQSRRATRVQISLQVNRAQKCKL